MRQLYNNTCYRQRLLFVAGDVTLLFALTPFVNLTVFVIFAFLLAETFYDWIP